MPMCSDVEAVVFMFSDGSHFLTLSNATFVVVEDGVRRVMVTFTNLEENRKYSASVHVQYNGGVVQQSQPVEISECVLCVPCLSLLHCLSEGTYDVQNVTLSFDDGGQLCITVLYVRGSKSQQSAMKLVCSSESHCCHHQLATINGTDWCFNNLLASSSCNVSVTDLDAVDSIDATPTVKYTDIIIVGPSSATGSIHHIATTTSLDTDMTTITVLPTESPTGPWLYI